jgi:uncharacterized protein (DUF885 family)
VITSYPVSVTNLLRRAFEKAAAEMPDYEQDEFARWLLDAIEADEKRWDTAFAESSEKLALLAKNALDEFRSGRTDLLDPEKL